MPVGRGQQAVAAAYVGRFAPTPSGPLHLGSLLTAVASWLDARAHHGRWRLRIDDLDAPRVVPGAKEAILAALVAHGLHWDGPIARQSQLRRHHRPALARLKANTFACRCTRRDLRGSESCQGTCRGLRLPAAGNAVRIRLDEPAPAFCDRVQGRLDAPGEISDFIVWRRDDMAAYPLAVAVDDQAMGITHVVRGADLLDNTSRQLHLIRHLGGIAPSYAHIPVLTTAAGEKLSKHNDATAIDDRAAVWNLAAVLCLLGLEPPRRASPERMLEWARTRWRIDRLARGRTLDGFVALE